MTPTPTSLPAPKPVRAHESPRHIPFRPGLRCGTETETTPAIETIPESSTDLDLPWNVILHNDPVNLMSYVCMVLQRVFGYPESKATELMLDVHNHGKTIVWTGEREKAEFYVQQLQSHQLLATMRKSA